MNPNKNNPTTFCNAFLRRACYTQAQSDLDSQTFPMTMVFWKTEKKKNINKNIQVIMSSMFMFNIYITWIHIINRW